MSRPSQGGDNPVDRNLHDSSLTSKHNPLISESARTQSAQSVPSISAPSPLARSPSAHQDDATSASDLHKFPTLHTAPRNDDELLKTSPGDLVNSVGSANSLSSAPSSVFSHAQLDMSAYGTGTGASGPPTLTPVTNTESSPPAKMLSPRSAKRTYEQMQNGVSPHRAPDASSQNASETITPIQTPPDPPKQARPGPKDVKGIKCTYDPEVDEKLSSSDRKRYKARYKAFGAEVRSTSTQSFHNTLLAA